MSTQAACPRECLGKALLRLAAQVGSVFRGTFALDEPEFDWGAGYARPAIPPQDLVIYEMGVRSFTADASAGVPPEDAGTFRGLQAKARPRAWLGNISACQHALVADVPSVRCFCGQCMGVLPRCQHTLRPAGQGSR